PGFQRRPVGMQEKEEQAPQTKKTKEWKKARRKFSIRKSLPKQKQKKRKRQTILHFLTATIPDMLSLILVAMKMENKEPKRKTNKQKKEKKKKKKKKKRALVRF